jgi:hypothetical protein
LAVQEETAAQAVVEMVEMNTQGQTALLVQQTLAAAVVETIYLQAVV